MSAPSAPPTGRPAAAAPGGVPPSALAHTGSRLGYRPALDGVRALAVYLVVAFHAGVGLTSGGFIGVDLFFVLSGYLVTSVILSDLIIGRFDLVEFYGRRVRRLLPAALFVLAVVALIWLAIAAPLDRGAVADDVRASALYFANWHFAAVATDYFASNDNASPLLHFWSLSVEEQFYLAWPLLVLLVWRGSRTDAAQGARRLAVVAILIAGASLLALVLTLVAGDADVAYYATHTRAYQLAGGAVLAIGVQTWRWGRATGRAEELAPVVQLGSLVVILVLASNLVPADPAVRGVGAAIAAVGLLLSLEQRPDGAVARALSSSALVYLGQISYATYLWHYPVIVVLRRFLEISNLTTLLVAAVVSTALAALSERLLELPIRKSAWLSRHSRAVAVTGLVASLVAGTVALPPILHSDSPPAVRAVEVLGGADRPEVRVPLAGFDVVAASAVPAGTDAAGADPVDLSCTTVDISQCLVVDGGGRRVLLMGDSHAGMLVPPFRAIAEREDYTLAVAAFAGCPWARSLVFSDSDQAACQATRDIIYSRVIPDFDPDLIMLVTRATDHDEGSRYSVEPVDPALADATQSELLADAAEQTVTELTDAGYEVVVVEPVPVSPVHMGSCISGARYEDECVFDADDTPSPAELSYRELAERLDGVFTLDLDRMVCPRLPLCDPIIAGSMVRKDRDHLTPRFAAQITDQIDWQLRAAGAI